MLCDVCTVKDVPFQDEWHASMLESEEPSPLAIKTDSATGSPPKQSKSGQQYTPKKNLASQAWSSSQREFFPAGMKSDELMDAVQDFTHNQMLRLDVPSSPPQQKTKIYKPKAADSSPAAKPVTPVSKPTPPAVPSSSPFYKPNSVISGSTHPGKPVTPLSKPLSPTTKPSSSFYKPNSVVSGSNPPGKAVSSISKPQPPVMPPTSPFYKPNAVGSSPLDKPVKISSKSDRPFIHGRHTCDSCKEAPIIGPRYHATNRDNLDTCRKCFSNSEFKGVNFSIVEDGTYKTIIFCFVLASVWAYCDHRTSPYASLNPNRDCSISGV